MGINNRIYVIPIIIYRTLKIKFNDLEKLIQTEVEKNVRKD